MAINLEDQLDAALQAYMDNSGYYAAGSVAQANLFITACRQLKILMPQMIRQAGRFEMQLSPKEIGVELAKAEQWVVMQGAADVRGFDFTDFRQP
jgi:hypothetical protein